MESFHDFEIVSYTFQVAQEKSFLEMQIKEGEAIKTLRFCNVETFKFSNINNFQNVILFIDETDITDFIAENREYFKRNLAYFPSVDAYRENLKTERYKVYVISASLGLTGWIIAKEMIEV